MCGNSSPDDIEVVTFVSYCTDDMAKYGNTRRDVVGFLFIPPSPRQRGEIVP
jgi:hypothetical protein